MAFAHRVLRNIWASGPASIAVGGYSFYGYEPVPQPTLWRWYEALERPALSAPMDHRVTVSAHDRKFLQGNKPSFGRRVPPASNDERVQTPYRQHHSAPRNRTRSEGLHTSKRPCPHRAQLESFCPAGLQELRRGCRGAGALQHPDFPLLNGPHSRLLDERTSGAYAGRF